MRAPPIEPLVSSTITSPTEGSRRSSRALGSIGSRSASGVSA
jgi:hypothetical protein